jgi:hypothetical protein
MTNDEELQNQIERTGAGEGIDARAYKAVFDALKLEPDFRPSAGFADRVLSRIQPARESKTEIVWMAIGIFSFVIAGVVAVFLTNYRLNFGVLKFVSGYPGLIAFGIAFVAGLHWLDGKFIKKSPL